MRRTCCLWVALLCIVVLATDMLRVCLFEFVGYYVFGLTGGVCCVLICDAFWSLCLDVAYFVK